MPTLVLILLLLTSITQARIINESEPNNSFAEADLIECGDTVQCANLNISQSDFFRMTVPGADSVYLRTFACGAPLNTTIVLYDSTFGLIDINYDSGEGNFSLIGWFAQVNQTCYLQVITFEGQGEYSLSFTCQVQENSGHGLCSSARPVTFWPYYDESSTLGAGHEIGSLAPDVYYIMNLATPGDLFVRVCSGGFDSRVQLLTQCVGGMMDDADQGFCQLGADLYLFGLQAQTYYLLVEGTAADQFGEFTIEIEPVLQECPAPQELILFSVGGQPFLDWLPVPEADYYLIEQASASIGPFEALHITTETFWQDPIGFALNTRFYRVRSICE